MLDPTRGGLAATLVEIAEDFNLTMNINELDPPVMPEVHGVCDMLGFDRIDYPERCFREYTKKSFYVLVPNKL